MNGIGQITGLFGGEILVVGGGMRAREDLATLGNRDFSCIISANSHGFKIPGLKPNFIVCKDHRHTETKRHMEPTLREFGVPIITRHYWGDFRLADWELQGNSGLMSIAVAAILGGGPIYPIGFDNFKEGTYWYDPHAKNISKHVSPVVYKQKVLRLAEQLFGTQVRPVSGPLLEVFKPFDPKVSDHPYMQPRILQKYQGLSGYQVRAVNEFQMSFDRRVTILPGTEFWISEAEYRTPGIRLNVELLDTELRM